MLMKCTKCKAEWTPPGDHTVTGCPFCGEPLFDSERMGSKSELHEILKTIVRQHGALILGERVLKGMLSDYLPNLERKYHNVLAKALDDRIGQQLLELTGEEESLRNIRASNIKEAFKTKNGFDNTAIYVIDSFLFSLGWIDKVETLTQQQNKDSLALLYRQIDVAFIDGSLKKEEAISLFEFASAMGISDDITADVIDKKISELQLEPDHPEDNKKENKKYKIITRDWRAQKLVKVHQASSTIENKYVKQLLDKIEGKNNYDEIAKIITNFQIPNSKDDLVNFLYFLGPRAKYHRSIDPWYSAIWRRKFDEAYHKLQQTYNDLEFKDYYGEINEASPFEKFWYGMTPSGKVGFLFFGGTALIWVILWIAGI